MDFHIPESGWQACVWNPTRYDTVLESKCLQVVQFVSSPVGQHISPTSPVCMYLLLKLHATHLNKVRSKASVGMAQVCDKHMNMHMSLQSATVASMTLCNGTVTMMSYKYPPHNDTCQGQFQDPALECSGSALSTSYGYHVQSLHKP